MQAPMILIRILRIRISWVHDILTFLCNVRIVGIRLQYWAQLSETGFNSAICDLHFGKYLMAIDLAKRPTGASSGLVTFTIQFSYQRSKGHAGPDDSYSHFAN